MDDQDGAGHVVEAFGQLRGLAGAAQADRVEEGPGGAGHRVGDERLDVLRADLAVEAVQGQLLQLGHGQLALAAAVHVALADVGADPLREQRRGGAARCGCSRSRARSAIQRAI